MTDAANVVASVGDSGSPPLPDTAQPSPPPPSTHADDGENDNEEDEEEEGEEDEEEEEEDAEGDDDDEEEAVDEDGEPDYIWLSPAEFNDPNLPYLLGAPANPNSTRTHSRRQKSTESLFPHLSDTLYRCKEYPHGIYINSYGQLCPDDKRSGLYQIDERAAENDTADDVLAQAEDAVAAKEAGLEEDEDDDDDDDDAEEEDKDNDDAPPDARDVTWVEAENKIRDKKGLKRKKVVPDEDEDDYKPESGDEDDDEEDDKGSEEGDAEQMETDDEFKDEELEGTDDDHEWDPSADRKEHDHTQKKKKKAKTEGGDPADDEDEAEDDDEDDEDDRDSQGRPLPQEADEYEVEAPAEKKKEPKVVLTPEQQKEAFLKSMKAAEESQAQMNKAADLRQRQRIQDQKNLRLLENWSEEWKKIRGKIFREEKASEPDPELRKKIKNTSITMTFEAHILSQTDPGCDFVFRKPVVRPKKGETGPKPTPLPPIAAKFDCTTSEVICDVCARRFSQMMGLYRHLAEHFMEFKIRAELEAAARKLATTSSSVSVALPPLPPALLPSAAFPAPVVSVVTNAV